ncbi:MAG: Gfo/Idh/MocA family oxidoreductase [Pseudolabrys sp.]
MADLRLGIVGSNYGWTVLLPAFRADPRCKVVALAGSDKARTEARAREAGVPKACDDWSALVGDRQVDAVAIAVPPALQAEIAIAALKAGKPVFAEKPMAATLADARAMLAAADESRLPAMIDLDFHRIAAWRRAKHMLDNGAIGTLRHIAVHWQVENASTRMRARTWKTLSDAGGGVLGNFVSHCLHAAMAFGFAGGHMASLAMSCASYLGSGHRVECYGEDGTLVLSNTTSDYMRGFELWHARRPAAALAQIAVEDPEDARYPDGRIAPVSRLARIFLDAIEKGGAAEPDFAAGYRVQQLIAAAQRSHEEGETVDVGPGRLEAEA